MCVYTYRNTAVTPAAAVGLFCMFREVNPHILCCPQLQSYENDTQFLAAEI